MSPPPIPLVPAEGVGGALLKLNPLNKLGIAFEAYGVAGVGAGAF